MRIVSLCPSLTELVFDLGRGAELLGVTSWCVHPAAGVAEIEKVGGTKDPDLARILALRPDLVLVNEEENRIEDARELAASGVRCHASMPRSPEGCRPTRSNSFACERPSIQGPMRRSVEPRWTA